MNRRWLACPLAISVALVTLVASATTVGLSPRVYSVGEPTQNESYSVVDPVTWKPTGSASWRTISGIGDCCENYLGVTPSGTLLDLGGDVLDFSGDRGQSWMQVQPNPNFTLGAEGSASAAPNGDIVGFTWDPYSGDHIISYKYSASENKWFYLDGNFHTPFSDRPWIGVIPGPFNIAGTSVPYISVLQAGSGQQEVLFMSYDGLTYVRAQSSLVDELTNLPTKQWLDPSPAPQLDAMQGNIRSWIVPLPDRRSIAKSILQFGCPYRMLDANLRWSCFTFPDGSTPHGDFQVDSKGRLHDLQELSSGSFEYRVSSDGGRSWVSTTINLPSSYQVALYDFKASGSSDTTVLALDAQNVNSGADQMVAMKISTANLSASNPPTISKVMFVGRGDVAFSHSLNGNFTVRFDFASVALFPDGKVAISFGDSSHISPGVAVEL